MKIPKKFQIKGHDWKVEYKWKLHMEEVGACDGQCDFEAKKILINRRLTPEARFKTFLHELTHAILNESHLHEAGGVDGFVEEVICESVANVFNKLFLFQVRPKKKKQTKESS